MLKNLNLLLKRAGASSIDPKNKEEVISALSCYCKMLIKQTTTKVRNFLYNGGNFV